jgi:hypothetical protein
MLSVATTLNYEPSLEDVLDARIDLTPQPITRSAPECSDSETEIKSEDESSDANSEPENDPEIIIEIDTPERNLNVKTNPVEEQIEKNLSAEFNNVTLD